jgi:hypothetical protein
MAAQSGVSAFKERRRRNQKTEHFFTCKTEYLRPQLFLHAQLHNVLQLKAATILPTTFLDADKLIYKVYATYL